MPKNDRVAVLVLFTVVAVIFGGLFLFRPYWGLMDDASHLFSTLPKMKAQGIFSYAWEQGWGDMTDWGMFRPTYPLMAYVLYRPGELWGPVATFFLNAVFSLAAVGYCAIVLARVVGVSRVWVLVGVAAFFYQYDLLQHPSLQEKMLLLTGAFLVRLSYGPRFGSRFVHFSLFVGTFLFALCVKASFMIFFSMAFWAFLSAQAPRLRVRDALAGAQVLAFGLAGLAAVVFFARISAHGVYTQQYSAKRILPNLLSPDGALFVIPLLLFAVGVARNPARFFRHPEKFTAFWGVLAFLTLFLPWGIKAYIQSIIGPAFLCLCVQCAEEIVPQMIPRLPARAWQIPLAALALLTALYRVPTMFLRLHDIGAAVAAAPEWEEAGVHEILVPCMEGADSMRGYLDHYAGTHIQVDYAKEGANLAGHAVFFDHALCPLPERAAHLPGCTSETELFRGSFPQSFRLVRGENCR